MVIYSSPTTKTRNAQRFHSPPAKTLKKNGDLFFIKRKNKTKKKRKEKERKKKMLPPINKKINQNKLSYLPPHSSSSLLPSSISSNSSISKSSKSSKSSKPESSKLESSTLGIDS